MIKISIVIPVYNINPLYLKKCIESLIGQTLKEIQIILVNDGSSDSSGAVCDKYSKIDKRIEVIHQKNQGVSVARNNGILNSKGEYIMFVDADDWMEVNTCEIVYSYVKKTFSDILIFGFKFSVNEKNIYNKMKFSNFKKSEITKLERSVISQREILKNTCVGSPWGKVFKKSFLVENNLFFDSRLIKSQDRIFMMNALCRSMNVSHLDFVGYIYNLNDDSICKKFNPKIINYLELVSDEMYEHIKRSHFKSKKFLDSYYVGVISFIYEYIKLFFYNSGNQMDLEKEKNY